jgi:hypothetical protein
MFRTIDNVSNNAKTKEESEATSDWKLFWAIENGDINELKDVCEELKRKNENVGMYFNMASWRDVFNSNESKGIRVYMCGCMDFYPIQHAADIKWHEGMKCLYDNNIGIGAGCGLPIILKDNNSTPAA